MYGLSLGETDDEEARASVVKGRANVVISYLRQDFSADSGWIPWPETQHVDQKPKNLSLSHLVTGLVTLRFCGLKGHELFAEVEEEYASQHDSESSC